MPRMPQGRRSPAEDVRLPVEGFDEPLSEARTSEPRQGTGYGRHLEGMSGAGRQGSGRWTIQHGSPSDLATIDECVKLDTSH